MTKRVRFPKLIPVLSKGDEPAKVVLLGRQSAADYGKSGSGEGPIICLPVDDTSGWVVGELVELEVGEPATDIVDPETLEALRVAARRKDEG